MREILGNIIKANKIFKMIDNNDRIEVGISGGKDSMSGSFNEINVPPTLVSFAVDVAKLSDVITPELKKAGNKLVQVRLPKDKFDLPDYDKVMAIYSDITDLMKKKAIVSAYAEDSYGIAAAVSKMAFGNGLGVKISDGIKAEELFANDIAEIGRAHV